MSQNRISRRSWLLKTTAIIGAGLVTNFGNKTNAISLADNCDVISCPPIPVEKPPCPVINEKWDLWKSGTCLRGANIWQKRVTADDGMGEGPVGPPYLPEDFPTLENWGANYLNLSYPGIFSEQKDRNGKYNFDQGVFENLERLIQKAEEANLFVVVSYRTGPGRKEIIFDGKKKGAVWDSEQAQDAWVEMWKTTAERLKNKKNVVGYDLMVEPEIKKHEKWNRLAGRIASQIRSIDQKTPILIGAADWSAATSLPCVLNSTESKVVYTVHQYNPWNYAQQKNGANIPYSGGLEDIYKCIYGFKVKRNAAVAVNEFGAKRWTPGIDRFLEEQFDYIERVGANHALWLWETSFPLNYDQFNFRRGTQELISAIKKNWKNNTIKFNDVKDKF
jgi:hypothetical protein